MTDSPALTTDALLGGHIRLVQPRDALRAGLDALLLQALVPDAATGRLVDLGAGTGAAGLAAASRCDGLSVRLVERQPRLVAALRATLALPDMAAIAARAMIVAADLADAGATGLEAGSADWIVANPPFFAWGEGGARPPGDALRRAQHGAEEDSLPLFLRAAARLAAPRARLALIHRPDRLPRLLDALHGRFGSPRLLPVHPRAGAPAGRILVAAEKGARGGLAILPGLVLHEADGRWTARAAALLDGSATLDHAWRQDVRRRRRATRPPETAARRTISEADQGAPGDPQAMEA